MKTFLFCIIMFVSFSGCGWVDRETAKITGHVEICIDGITYIQFSSGACVKVDTLGLPVRCK